MNSEGRKFILLSLNMLSVERKLKYSEYLDFLKKHEEQKSLEEYQKTRRLPRPKTKRIHLIIYISLYIILISGMCLMIFLIKLSAFFKAMVFSILFLLFSEFYLRFIGIKCVECYQHYATDERRRRCLCIPSCSEYAIICFKRYSLIKALLKIRKRLYKTCQGDEYKKDPP